MIDFQIPLLDDSTDRESYKVYKWMVEHSPFNIAKLKKLLRKYDNDDLLTILAGMAACDLLYIVSSDGKLYSSDESFSLSIQELSASRIYTSTILNRYIEKRKSDDIRWCFTTFIAFLSLIIGIVSFATGLLNHTVNVNITSWPATAETAQLSELRSQ